MILYCEKCRTKIHSHNNDYYFLHFKGGNILFCYTCYDIEKYSLDNYILTNWDIEIIKNIYIIKQTGLLIKNDRKLKHMVRRAYAIYRLYKYLNISPKYIAWKTKISYYVINRCIGSVFKKECLKSNKCSFKGVFINEKK